ncbi:MAG: hypothetical protein K6D02_08185 [Lachnospiraceae bacterium]|nr:hypothetical protein [Lachnospiraceae bacterium]
MRNDNGDDERRTRGRRVREEDRRERSGERRSSSRRDRSDGASSERRVKATKRRRDDVENRSVSPKKRSKKVKKSRNNRDGILAPIEKYISANIFILLICFIVVVALIFVHIINLLNVHGDDFKKQVLKNKSYVGNTIKFKRGSITDRNGNVLAQSKRVFDVIIDPKLILEKRFKNDIVYDGTLIALEEVFGMDRSYVIEQLEKRKDSHYVVLKEYKGVSNEKKEEFEKLEIKVNKAIKDDRKDDKSTIEKYKTKIGGVTFEERYERYYPYKTVAGDLIGIASDSNVGSFGIESKYNEELNGEDGKSYKYYINESDYEESVKDATDGNNIISTIDVNIQGVVEQHIASFMDQMGAKNIGVILMDPNSGEILAMASDPVYDLNNPTEFGFSLADYIKKHYKRKERKNMTKSAELSAVWKSYCITDEYEPGSTLKPFTVAACLEEGAATNASTYMCDGGQSVNGVYIKCCAHNTGGHGQITLEQALMKSCNDALMSMSAKLGKRKFLSYINNYGFGRQTGIDLPGEATGQIFNNSNMGNIELATSSFGQGQTVTMIQMAAGFSSLVNGGEYYVPHLMKEVTNNQGVSVKNYNTTPTRRTISEDTSKLIRKYLYSTVEEGTANPASVAGYTVCGKTGTAEKHPTGRGNYLVSFIGCVPKDDPKLVCYVVIDEPDTEDQAHSTYATQFASYLLEDVMPLMELYPEDKKAAANATPKPDGMKKFKVTIPSTENGNLYEGAPEGGYADKSYGIASGSSVTPGSTDFKVPSEYTEEEE